MLITTPCQVLLLLLFISLEIAVTRFGNSSMESTAQKLSFEQSQLRISTGNSNIRTAFFSIINSTTGNYWSFIFI